MLAGLLFLPMTVKTQLQRVFANAVINHSITRHQALRILLQSLRSPSQGPARFGQPAPAAFGMPALQVGPAPATALLGLTLCALNESSISMKAFVKLCTFSAAQAARTLATFALCQAFIDMYASVRLDKSAHAHGMLIYQCMPLLCWASS